jgi:hypothetical protein
MMAAMDVNDFNQRLPHSSRSQSFSHLPPPRPARGSSVWVIIGIVLAVLLCIGGLVVVGLVVLFFVGMSHYGSNK